MPLKEAWLRKAQKSPHAMSTTPAVKPALEALARSAMSATPAPAYKTLANAENMRIVRRAHGFVYGGEVHPKHFIDTANEDAVRALHSAAWDEGFRGIEYATSVDGTALVFAGMFIDRAEFQVCCTTPEAVLQGYPRGNALVSLLFHQKFAGAEAFAVACENALGADVCAVALAGRMRAVYFGRA